MSAKNEPISVRTTRLNNLIVGKSVKNIGNPVANGLSREGLIDALNVLYNECSKHAVKKFDNRTKEFVYKYRSIIKEAQMLRVNCDDFDVKSLVGKGYFGKVYLVLEKSSGDVYAMKKIRKLKTIDSVRHERDIMASHKSEWITSLQYAFQDIENLYLIMEYLPGGDLLALMSRNAPFDEDLARFYLAELTLAINALHCMGYVHRDIKPENILVDRLGHLKLADFGSAAALDSAGHAICFSPVGSPDYIAPELLQTISLFKPTKSVHDVTCDFWSLGIIGYEFVFESTPFHNQNIHETYSRILTYVDDTKYAGILNFPSDVSITNGYKNLLQNLIVKPNRRMTYLQIVRHPFFEGINWDNLRQQVPPIIPTVHTEDDTSNFDDFSRKKNPRSLVAKTPSVESLKSNEFSGQDLPFLGYAYVHDAAAITTGASECYHENIKTDDSLITKLDGTIKELQKTIKEQVREIKSLQENSLNAERKVAHNDSLNKILHEAKDELGKMKEKLKEKTIELAASKTEIKTLKSSLKIEEEMRAKSEANIFEVVNSTYQKWEKAKIASDQRYEKKDAEKNLELMKIGQRLQACETELSTRSEECQHLQEKLASYKEMLRALKQQKLDEKTEFERSQSQLTEAYDLKILELKNRLRDEKDRKSKLCDELRDVRCELDESICSTNSNKQAKIMTDRNIDEMKQRLSREIEENQHLRSKSSAAEKKFSDLEKSYEIVKIELEILKKERIIEQEQRSAEMGSGLLTPYRSAHSSLSDVRAVEEQLRIDLNIAKQNEESQRKRAEELEEVVRRFEEMIKKIDQQPKSVGDLLAKQNETLEDKLAAVREQAVVERQAARTANLSMWKLEKQVEDLTSEKNLIARRMELTEEKIKRTQNEKSELERQLKETESILNVRETQIGELKTEIADLKQDLNQEHKRWEKVEDERTKEKCDAIEQMSRVHRLEEKLKEVEEKYRQAANKLESLTQENRRLTNELNDELNENNKLNEQIQDQNIQLKTSNSNYEMLKVACTITDSQLSEMEILLETEQARLKAAKEKSDELWKKICERDEAVLKLKQEINKLTAQNEDKSVNVKSLRNELEVLERNCDEQQAKIISQQEELIEKTRVLFSVQEKCEVITLEASHEHEMKSNFAKEILILKEENTKFLTELFTKKEENKKLSSELKEAKDKISELQQELDQISGILAEQKNYYMQRDIKSEATLAQHKKLVDYLQLKIEDLSNKKKKCLVDKIFGTKENISPNTIETNILYKTVQEELRREKNRTKDLEEQLTKAKCESSENINRNAVKSANIEAVEKKMDEEVQEQLPDFDSTDFFSACETDLHSTPHRFELTSDSSSSAYKKCMGCQLEILHGSPYWACKECSKAVHRKCRGKITSDRCAGYQTQSDNTSTSSGCFKSFDDQVEGVLSSTEENRSKQLILKSGDFQPNIHVNCLYQTSEDIILLGCKEGLFSYHLDDSKLAQINGLYNVSCISVSKYIAKAILIGSDDHILYQCDFRLLLNRSQASACMHPSLDFAELDCSSGEWPQRGDRWNLVKISQECDMAAHVVAIAATITHIVILKYDLQVQRFKAIRFLDTAQEVSSIFFTRHSAIVSSDKFFEIELHKFFHEEFIDGSDASLVHTSACHPMSLFRISSQEFLLCYEEFGIFVDEFGCRSRPNDLHWEYKPTGFMYREPFLYISHFQLLQVLRVNRSFTKEMDSAAGRGLENDQTEQKPLRGFLNLNMPNILAKCGKHNVYVCCQRDKMEGEQELLIIDGLQMIKAITNFSLETISSVATYLTEFSINNELM